MNTYTASSKSKRAVQHSSPLSPSADYKRTYDIQSQQIYELNNYKSLCEELITKLNPNQSLPITKKDVELLSFNPSSHVNDASSSLQHELSEVKNALQHQTMLNDKQRNVIALLKQTLESNLVKNGIQLNPAMNQSQTINSLNEIIDVSKITTENELAKKELSKANMIISDLQNGVDSLKKANEDLTNANSQLKMKYDITKSNKDSLSSQLENEVNKQRTLNDNIRTLHEQNENIKNNLTEYQSMCSKYEAQLFEKGRKINELNNALSSYEQLQKQFNDNKMLYDHLDKNYQRLNKEKTDIELTLRKSKDEVTQLKNKQSELYKEMADNDETFHKEKQALLDQKEEVQRALNKADNTINDMKKILHNKEQEILKYQQLVIENDKQNMKLTNQIEDEHKAFNKQQTDALTEIDILHSKVNDLTSQLEHIKQLYTELQPQYQDVSDENVAIKTKLGVLEIEKEKIINENKEMKSLLDNSRSNYELKANENKLLNETVTKLKQDNDTLSRELPFWKEKYNKDTKSQANDIMLLKNTINDLQQQINDTTKQNAKITNENISLNDVYTNTKYDLDNMNNAYTKLVNDNENAKKEVQSKEKRIAELEGVIDSLQNEKYANLTHIKELTTKINDIVNEKAKIETLSQDQHKQMDEMTLQSANKDKQYESLENTLRIYQNIINKCIEIIVMNNDKVLNHNKDNYNANFYSNHFIKYIQSLYMLSADAPGNNDNDNGVQKLQTIASFLEEIMKEHFNLTNASLELHEQVQMLNNKNVSLQNNISEFANNIHKANVYIENNESKLKQVFEDNLSYKQSNEDLMHKLSAQRNEIERVSFELNNMIEQSKQLNTMNKELMHDNENKAKALNDALYQKNAFEERIVILNKEKKLYDRILNTMCYCSNIKNVSSIISDLMKIVDDIAMIEREKVKLHNEGRNVNAVECKLLEKHKEFDAVYQVFQKELNKQKEMPLSKKNGGSKDTYLYTSTNNNTNSSVNGFSPVHTYMDNNSSYQKHKTMNSDYDRYGTLHSGEYSMYKSSV